MDKAFLLFSSLLVIWTCFIINFKENRDHNFGQKRRETEDYIVVLPSWRSKGLDIQIAKGEVFPEQEGRKKEEQKNQQKT